MLPAAAPHLNTYEGERNGKASMSKIQELTNIQHMPLMLYSNLKTIHCRAILGYCLYNIFTDTLCGVTCDCELPLCADSGSVIAGDAGVVAVVFKRHLGYLEGAHELLGVDGDARGGHDLLSVLAPRDAYGHVSGRHHTGDVHQFADGSWREVKWLDEWRY